MTEKWRRIERGLYELPKGTEGKPRFAAEWVHNGRKIRRRFPTATKAREVLYAVRGQIIEGRYIDRRREVKTTLEEAVKKFLKWGEENIAEATQGYDAIYTARWTESPNFKGRTLEQITPVEVEAYKLEEKTAHGIRAADYSLARLRRMYNLCMAWGLCKSNPVSGGKVKFYNPKGRRDRYVTPEEEALLLANADPRLVPAIVFSLHTGLRQGELLTLTWSDFDKRVGQYGEVKVRGDIAKDREDRHVPLTATARATLDALPRAIKGESRIFGFLGSSRAYPNKLWFATLRAAKVNEGVPRARRITWHTLRHTYASRLVMAGVDLATIQKLMGHADISTTMRYAHLARPHVESAVLVLDRIGKLSVNIAENGNGEPAP